MSVGVIEVNPVFRKGEKEAAHLGVGGNLEKGRVRGGGSDDDVVEGEVKDVAPAETIPHGGEGDYTFSLECPDDAIEDRARVGGGVIPEPFRKIEGASLSSAPLNRTSHCNEQESKDCSRAPSNPAARGLRCNSREARSTKIILY